MMCTYIRCVFNDVHFYNDVHFPIRLLPERRHEGGLEGQHLPRARGRGCAGEACQTLPQRLLLTPDTLPDALKTP